MKIEHPSADDIARFTEAKATRDIHVYNGGVANKTYVVKAGPRARFAIGQKVEISEPYLRETWNLFCKVISEVSSAVIAKAR